jgi:predicted RNA-binding protein with PUA-like domain
VMNYWLMKSEPEAYSIDQLKADKKTLWSGVRNYQARNYMTGVPVGMATVAMTPGDLFFFYHSNAEPTAIVGVGKILKINQPDPTALDPKSDYYDPKASSDHPIWFCAEVGFVEKWKTPITLAQLKAEKALAKMVLLQKGSRLSVQPVTKSEFDHVMKMKAKADV